MAKTDEMTPDAGVTTKKNKKVDKNPYVDPVPSNAELEIELGVEDNLPFTTPFYDEKSRKRRAHEELNELLRGDMEDYGPTIPQLVAMRRLDGQARALYRLLTLPIRAALQRSSFVAAEGGDKEAEFIDQVFNLPPQQGGMDITFHRFMAQLLQALFDGFAPFEQVFWKPSYGPLKDKYTLKKLAYRPSDTITFIVDEHGGFQGFRQRASVAGKVVDVYIPRDRAFYYAAQEEERKFYGVSFFQSAFYHYDKKIKVYYIAHLAAQRSAVGIRVGYFPQQASKENRREFAYGLANLGLAQWLTAPETYKVEMLNATGTMFPFLEYVNHHNSQMSKSILATFFDKEQGGDKDSALVSFGQPGDDMFMLMLRAIMDDIAAAINQFIIPRLIDWNFEGGKYPHFQWAALSDEQREAVYNTFDKLSTSGASMNTTPEFMRELEKQLAHEMGLDIDYDKIEEEEEEERKKLEAQQDLLVQQDAGLPVTPEDQAISDFENAATGATPPAPAPADPAATPVVDPRVKLTSEQDLLNMAGDLLDRVTLANGERRVKTPEGEQKYGSAIGSVITRNQNDKLKQSVTIERLLSLKRQVNKAKKTAGPVELAALQRQLAEAVRVYAGNKGPVAVRAALDSLTGTKKK